MDISQPAAEAAPKRDHPTIWAVDDVLWAELEPVLRVDKPRTKPGRPRRDDRAICDGLIWLARTGSHWTEPPRRFGPTSTGHARFSGWVESGALEQAWAVLVRVYDDALGLDWDRQAADGCIVTAPFGNRGGRRGGGHGPQPHRPRQTRHQAPPPDRGQRDPGRGHRHRRESP